MRGSIQKREGKRGVSWSVVYDEATMETPVVTARDTVRATIRLHNTGSRPAHEIVQVYVRDSVTSASWADKELKAYRHVDLAPGESAVVDVEVAVTDCTILNAAGERIVEPGDFELLIGPSSRDEVLRAVSFTVV